jgi:hypothetical protein
MVRLYNDDKGWLERVEDWCGIIIPHITKIGRTMFQGIDSYFYQPRIGIDFFDENENRRGFIPNLDLGDVARLARILELAQQDHIFNGLKSRAIKAFEIGLSFEKDLERKITLDVDADRLVLSYVAFHKDQHVDFDHNLSREGAHRLVDTLKRLVVKYQSVILEYVMTGEVDERFKWTSPSSGT